MRRGREFQIRAAEKRKARDPNDRLCCGMKAAEKRMSVKTLWTDSDARGL